MIYSIGDKIECIIPVNFPDENSCHWYEMTSAENKSILISAWNDYPEHMILQECFEKK